MANTARRSVTVEAPARLHLGFLDLAGDLGRKYLSLGLTLEHFSTRVTVERAGKDEIEGFELARTKELLARLRRDWAIPPVLVEVEAVVPAHIGLGSGTQLGVALGLALARLTGRSESAREIAALTGRGARSGIGIGAFEAGGLLLDGGKGEGAGAPPLLARLPFPESWRVILLLDGSRRGLSGGAETGAFKELPSMTPELSATLCREVLVRLLPAVAEADLAMAGAGLGSIQRLLGDYFASAQGGRFTSPVVAEALNWLEGQGIQGVGQTSWGPTGFALVSARRGPSLVTELSRLFPDLGLELVRGRNRGAVLSEES